MKIKTLYSITGDAYLIILELKEHLSRNQGEQILLRMCAYSANITGSDSYWYTIIMDHFE